MPPRPWDSPFRAFPSRGAVPPLDGLVLPHGFEVDRDSGAKTPCVSDRFPPRAASWPCSEPPLRDSRARLVTRERGFPRSSVHPTTARVAPHAVRADDRRPSGSPARGRFARLEALLPSGVRSRDRPRAPPSLRPKVYTADRAGALLGFRPFRAFSATTSGSVRLRRPPGGEAERSRKSKPRSGRRNRGFDPEV